MPYCFLPTKTWVSVGCTKPIMIVEESPGGGEFFIFSLNQANEFKSLCFQIYSRKIMSFSCKESLEYFLFKVLYLFLWQSISAAAGSAFSAQKFCCAVQIKPCSCPAICAAEPRVATAVRLLADIRACPSGEAPEGCRVVSNQQRFSQKDRNYKYQSFV